MSWNLGASLNVPQDVSTHILQGDASRDVVNTAKHGRKSPPESPQMVKSPRTERSTLTTFENNLKGKLFGGNTGKPSQSSGNSSTLRTQQNEMDTNDNNDSEKENVSRVRKYPDDHKGPFIVYVRSFKDPVHHLTIARHLFKSYKEMLSCKRVTSHKLKVDFSNSSEANKLLNDPYLKEFRVYVPANSVEIDGLVNFPVENDASELLEGVCSFVDECALVNVQIVEAFRLNARCKEDTTKFKPCTLVRVMNVRFEVTCAPIRA